MKKRIVITGLGVVSPCGNSITELWESMINGRSGIDYLTKINTEGLSCKIGGEVKNFDISKYNPDKKTTRRWDSFVKYAFAAAKQAIDDSKLEFKDGINLNTGVLIGSGIGGLETIERNMQILIEKGPSRVTPFFAPMLMSNAASAEVALHYQLHGPTKCVSSACTSANDAIAIAYKELQESDWLSVMITGGAEATITKLAFAGFGNMGALSSRNDDPKGASRPFDKDRDGFVMSEGGAVLVIETLEHAIARGAKIYAELLAYGSSTDAYHITAPDPDGSGAILAMKRAVEYAGITPEQIDYINAHGTSTPLNDKTEVNAIRKYFGAHADKLAVSSTKSMTGHLLGAAGGIETLITALTIHNGIIPPTINYHTPDPECNIDCVPNTARKNDVNYALTNSFGFGGHNTVLLLKRYEP